LPAQSGQQCFPILGIMAPRKKTLEELKKEAIAELERRGYDVRGRTPAQIRQMLRRRPTKAKITSNPNLKDYR